MVVERSGVTQQRKITSAAATTSTLCAAATHPHRDVEQRQEEWGDLEEAVLLAEGLLFVFSRVSDLLLSGHLFEQGVAVAGPCSIPG
jgi:hypothetical protein